MDEKKTIVISAVNLNIGGTLTILKNVLHYLSEIADRDNYRIVALVHKKDLAFYPNIEYIEMPWAKKKWINRIWCEYVTMKKTSRQLSPIYLWFSLHDTTPNVIARRRAVYCHNSFPFYRWNIREFFLNYKIVMFATFSKYAYKINIKKNDYVVVQQSWLRNEFVNLFGLDSKKIIVSYPDEPNRVAEVKHEDLADGIYRFFFASSPNSHKNFELICNAAGILEKKGVSNFEINLTIDGSENSYSKWIYNKYKHLKCVNFIGFQSAEGMAKNYSQCDCLIFPSKIETWGLPISEFAKYNKPMLVSDLAYAHSTTMGSKKTAFFDPYNVIELENLMGKLIKGDVSFLSEVQQIETEQPYTHSWDELFNILLK